MPIMPVLAELNALQLISMQQYLSYDFLPSNVKSFQQAIDSALRGGPLRPDVFWKTAPDKGRRLQEAFASTDEYSPRSLPLNAATFYFILVLVGLIVPAWLHCIERNSTTKSGRLFRLLKSQFTFAFLIRV